MPTIILQVSSVVRFSSQTNLEFFSINAIDLTGANIQRSLYCFNALFFFLLCVLERCIGNWTAYMTCCRLAVPWTQCS